MTTSKIWRQNSHPELSCERRLDYGNKLYLSIMDERIVRQGLFATPQRVVSFRLWPEERSSVEIFGKCEISADGTFRPLMGAGYLRPLKHSRRELPGVQSYSRIRYLNKNTRLQERQWWCVYLRKPRARGELIHKSGICIAKSKRAICACMKQIRCVAWDVYRSAAGWNIISACWYVETSHCHSTPPRIDLKYQVHPTDKVCVLNRYKNARISDNKRKDQR